MGLPRSTFYDAPPFHADNVEILGRIKVICDEFETYGYRRVRAELRHQGIIVNGKKIRRLMREMTCSPSAVGGSSRPLTASMISPYSGTKQRTRTSTDLTSSGLRTLLTSKSQPASYTWRLSSMLGHAASLAARSAVRSMRALPLRL